MTASICLLASFLAFLSSAPAADSPATLASEMREAFAKSDASLLANRKFFTLLTGDVPIRPNGKQGDPDGLSNPIPNLYKVTSANVLTPAEARSIEEKRYTRDEGPFDGYVAVDFIRREDSEPKAQITAIRRYYPYELRADGCFLVFGK